MEIRYGSKFQSYLTNGINPNHRTIINDLKVPTNGINSVDSGQQKSTNHKNPDSLIESGMQRSNDVIGP
jgi:hypothetical protein